MERRATRRCDGKAITDHGRGAADVCIRYDIVGEV
jgi:hypothetical protein